ncbi:MAG TPA: PLDc N-terminal domain-containing protein [Candidatus Dojkabacteria bacterium]|jgi:prolipoprotein diacylglyceryltransferase
MDNTAAESVLGLFGLGFTLIWCLFYLCCFLFFIVSFVFWVWMLIVLIQKEDRTFETDDGKLLWVLILLLGGVVGAILFYFMEYKKKRQLRNN